MAKKTEVKGLSVSQRIWRSFKQNRLALISGILLIIIYSSILVADFIAPYPVGKGHDKYTYAPPHQIHFVDQEGKFHFRPFVYKLNRELDYSTYTYVYKVDHEKRYPIYFMVRGEPYRLFSIFKSNLHLFGNPDIPIFLMGSDERGRDILSRIIFGGRISLTIGLVGVAMTTIIGVILGAISGYYGGVVDNVMQRIIEVLISLPRLPVYIAISAAFPDQWSSIKVFFMMVIILSIVNWGGLARQIRGKVLAIRETEFIAAAKSVGASEMYIILKHTVPNCLSHIIVMSTLAIPGIILAESTLSFLGLGIQPPMVSLGVLLEKAQTISYIENYPWTLFPGFVIVIIILLLNFLGDGIRDAADPYSI